MEDFSHILLFKTNLEACHKKWLQEVFDNQEGIKEWNIDLDDDDRVLRIISYSLTHQYIIQLITNNGYECCELT